MVFTFGTPVSYGIIQQPLAATFDVPLVDVSTVFSVMFFTFFVGSGVVGVFAARLPARPVILSCAGATAVLAPALYYVNTYLGLAVVFAVLGLALGTVYVLLASIVPRWFDERRGAATGLIFVGNGLGLFALPPVWQAAIARFGVRAGFLTIASVTAVAFAVAGLACRRPRWVTGSVEPVETLLRWVRDLAATRSFQALFVGMGLAFAWYQLLAAYAVDLFATRGLTEATASAAFGLVGGVSIVSRIGGGYVADAVGARRTFLASLGSAALGLLVLLAPDLSLLPVSVALIGLGLGGCATIYIPLLLAIYDPERDTAVVGIFNVAAGIGTLAMPPLGVATIAYTDGYTATILLTFSLTVVAFFLVVAGTSWS